MLPSFAYVRPTSLDEALKHLADGKGRVHAGGTDLLGCLRDGVFETPTVVSLSGIPALRGIEETPEGAAHRRAHAASPRWPRARSCASASPALAEAAAQVASPQLRNQGTLGGNLCQKPRCWYYRGDFACLRKGGDALLRLRGRERVPRGLRRRPVLHRPPLGHRSRAHRARRDRARRRARRAAAPCRSTRFFVPAEHRT